MPNTLVQPYLFFGGRCEEALAFYRTALGAEVNMLMLHKDSPEPPPPGMLQPGFENKVMHATSHRRQHADGLRRLRGRRQLQRLLAVALRCRRKPRLTGYSPRWPTVVRCRCRWRKPFWSPRFGMLTDRFGISWMVNVEAEAPR